MRWWGWTLIALGITAPVAASAYWFRFYLSEPERTYVRLHDAACRGDADTFFALHDMSEVKETMVTVVKAKSGAGKLAEAIVEKEWDDAIDNWREDIEKKRWNGDICAWELVSVRRTLTGGQVVVRQPSGKERFMKMKQFGDGPFATTLVVESYAMGD